MRRTCTIVRKLVTALEETSGICSLGSSSFGAGPAGASSPKSYLTDHVLRPYPAVVTDISRRSYFYGFFYYGFPLAGRDWRRTRE